MSWAWMYAVMFSIVMSPSNSKTTVVYSVQPMRQDSSTTSQDVLHGFVGSFIPTRLSKGGFSPSNGRSAGIYLRGLSRLQGCFVSTFNGLNVDVSTETI